MPGVSPQERRTVLNDSCHSVEEFSYLKEFSPEEIVVKKDEAITRTDELLKLNKKIADANSVFNAQIKEVKTMQARLIGEVKTGREEVTEDVYLMADQENSVMQYVNDNGTIVYERPLLPNEKQLSLVSQAANVN